ncbi:MAG TPA: tetratricopeptide repeat protein [Pyrinomonadaceae bacterium]
MKQTEANLQYRLGLRYVNKDDSAAFQNFQRAAQRGHAAASYQLARMYMEGRGVPRDSKMALHWLRKAANGGHAAAQYALVELENSTRATRASSPAVALARSSDPVLGEIEKLDQIAHQKQLNFAKKFATKRESFTKEWRQLIDAEVKLSKAFNHGWASIPYTRSVAVELSQPLSLAMFQLQSEVRRRLGPEVHTIVPGLASAAGCQKDFVKDRVLSRYALAVTGEDSSSAVETLKEEAIQTACLGRRQLADLEWAIATGFEDVASTMRKRGLSDVVPLFAQMVAPVQVLILDARKHRGERSLSWKWFVTYGPELKRLNAAQSHWPTGNLYLWSRTNAMLVGFPMCLPGTGTTQCVDLQKFLESLMDPRAIGLGDCALSGMIANGLTTFQGVQRYVCPSLSCGQTAPGTGATGTANTDVSEARGRLADRWPSSGSADDLLVEQTEGTGQLCRNASDSSLQSAGPLSSDCINSVFGQEANPWDTYLTCMADGAGTDITGVGVPEVGVAPLPGVPMGKKCGLMEDGGTTPTPAPSDSPNTADEEEKEAKEEKPPEIPPTRTSGTTPSRSEVAPKTKEDTDRSIWQTLREFFRTLEGAVRPARDTDQEERERLKAETQRQQRESAKSCADETSCPDNCTGLGSQIAKAKDCTDQLLKTFGEALGRRRPQPQPGEVHPSRPRVIIYDPENAPLPESNIGACVMGDQGPSKGPNPCQFVLCPGIAGLATPVGTDCSCGQNTQPYKSVEKLCMLDCVGGLVDSNCKCAPSELNVERMPETMPSRSGSFDRSRPNRGRVP